MREDLRKALEDSRHQDRTTVFVVVVDGEERVPGYEAWWDVPVAEASETDTVRRARAGYERARSRERYYL